MIYDEIYVKFYHVIVSYCYRRVKDEFYAEEVASDTFHLLWKEWDTTNFPNENALLSWLYKTAAYKIKEHKRDKRHNYIPLDSELVRNIVDLKAAVDYEDIDPQKEEQKYRAYMSELRSRLNEKEQKLFDLVIVEKQPHKIVAEEWNTSVAAVKMRCMRLRRRLKQIFNEITDKKL